MATQLYAKKWLIYAPYTLQPKEIRANCGLAVNSSVSFCRMEYYLKTAKTCDKTPIFFNLFKLQKLVFFAIYIKTHGLVRMP